MIYPLAFLSALSPDSNKTLFYKAVRESQLADRELIVPSGGMLGGGSSINLMMYSRAQRHDWDSWKMPGWSANDMIPFLKKVSCQMKLTVETSKEERRLDLQGLL